MLTNRILFARLMALLRNIDPCVPLPEALEPRLWKDMMEEDILKYGRVLEERFNVHKKAYYIVTGFVIVFAFDPAGDLHSFRIYLKNGIVALDSFMSGRESEYMIWACPRVVLWSVSKKVMESIYKEMPGMELMAQKTALRLHTAKECMREGFLMLPDELRVLKFYKEKGFCELLPPRSSPIRDKDIADYVDLSLVKFRRTRRKLIKKGLL